MPQSDGMEGRSKVREPALTQHTTRDRDRAANFAKNAEDLQPAAEKGASPFALCGAVPCDTTRRPRKRVCQVFTQPVFFIDTHFSESNGVQNPSNKLPTEANMIDLSVYSLSQAKRHKRKFGAIITLESPNARPAEKLRFTEFPRPPHLILRFEDIDEAFPRVTTASIDDARQIINFGREHADKRVLVHCQAGIGRSGAAGLAILADQMGPGQEAEAIQLLMEIRPEACPNLLLTIAADEALGRNGALTVALLAENSRRPKWQQTRKNKTDFYHKCPHEYT